MTTKPLTPEEFEALSPQDAIEYAHLQVAQLSKKLAFAKQDDISSIEEQVRRFTMVARLLEQNRLSYAEHTAPAPVDTVGSSGKSLPKLPLSTPMVRTMNPKIDFRDDLRDFTRVMMANKIAKEHWPFFLIDRIDDSHLMCILDPAKPWADNMAALHKHLLPADYLLSDAAKFDSITWYPHQETLVAMNTRYKFLANDIEYPLDTVYACNHYLKVLRKAEPDLAAFVKQQLVAIHHNSAEQMVYNVEELMEIARTYTPTSTVGYRQATTTTRTSFANEASVVVDSPRSGSNSQPTSRDASPARPDVRMLEYTPHWTPGRGGSPHPTAGSTANATKMNPRQPRDFGPNVPANNLRSTNPGVLKHNAPVPAPRLMSIFCDEDPVWDPP